MFEFDEEYTGKAQIRVAGVGGAGGNAVNGMVSAGLTGVDFLVVNTDAQALDASIVPTKIQIGGMVTRGLGSGGDPRTGEKAIEEDHSVVAEALAGSDMVFVTAGMGGGTGTGAAPTVARIARELGALVVGIVTLPFSFEGRRRSAQGIEGLEDLKAEVDTLIVIPNDRLLKVVPANTPLTDAFRVADNVLYQATKGISDLITVPGLVNLDFADVRSIMAGMGDAIMGTGVAKGEHRAQEAAQAAISSPLLEEVDVRGAQGVLVNISGGPDMSLHEVSEITNLVQQAVGAEANMIFGAVIDKNIGEEMRVTVIATGFGAEPAARPAREAEAAISGLVQRAAEPVSEIPVRSMPQQAAPVSTPPATHAQEQPTSYEATEPGRPAAHSAEAALASEQQPVQPKPIELKLTTEPHSSMPPARQPGHSEQRAARQLFGNQAEAAAGGDTSGIRPLVPRPAATNEQEADAAADPEASAFGGGAARDRAPSREELDKPAFLRRTMD